MQNSSDKPATITRAWVLKICLVALLALAGLLFVFIAHEAVYEKEKGFDDAVFADVASISSPGFIHAMEFITFFGSPNFLVPAYGLLIAVFLFKRQFAYGIDLFVLAAGSTALNQGLKVIFHRHRPEHPVISGVVNYSFPSGHALSAFVFCSILILIVFRLEIPRWSKALLALFLALFAISIALSRVTLKVHFPTDVLASFCLGTVWVIGTVYLLRLINHHFGWGSFATFKDQQKDRAV